MMRRSKQEHDPSAVEQAGQRNWNEIWGYHRDTSKRYFILACLAVGVVGLQTVRGWVHDSDPRQIPWVIDRSGPSLLAAHLVETMPNAARISGHLTDWIRDVRTVTSDPIVQKTMVDQAYAWTDSNSIAKDQLDTWFVANKPNERVKENTVDVDHINVIAQGGDSWLIDWTETAYPRKTGQLVQTTAWRMSVTVTVHLPTTDDEIKTNWDGVFVTSLHLLSLSEKPR